MDGESFVKRSKKCNCKRKEIEYEKSIYYVVETLDFLSGSWEKTIAPNIRTHPKASLVLGISCKTIIPDTKEKTDSKLISKEAMAGSACFCATICKVNATPPDKTPKYNSGIAQSTMSAQVVGSKMIAKIPQTRKDTKNCRKESLIGSTFVQ